MVDAVASAAPLPASRLARTFGRTANGRDAVMKVGHLLDQLVKLPMIDSTCGNGMSAPIIM
jgi:hypothetical protein